MMFTDLNHSIREEVIALLFHAQVEASPEDGGGGSGSGPSVPQPGGNGGGSNGNLRYEHESLAGADAIAAAGGTAAVAAGVGGESPQAAPVVQTVVKGDHGNVGRNDPCWCGSGKKYKRCHGA
jgi:preprotein translocase subunit SecA